jgi:hypothetical protein
LRQSAHDKIRILLDALKIQLKSGIQRFHEVTLGRGSLHPAEFLRAMVSHWEISGPIRCLDKEIVFGAWQVTARTPLCWPAIGILIAANGFALA